MSAIFTATQQQEILRSYLPRIDDRAPCPFDDLPNEVKGCIFNLLASDPKDFASLSLACRQLYVISKMVPPPVPENAFGKAAWKEHFGVDVGEEPPLPPNIHEILQSPCPYWEGKKTGETHDLLLIPKTVNGKPLTIEALQKIAQNLQDVSLRIDFQGGGISASHVNKGVVSFEVPESYWALISKEVLPNSRNKSYSKQQSALEGSYTVPKTLEVATKILTHYVQTQERLYSDSSWTRCQEVFGPGFHSLVSFGETRNVLRLYQYRDNNSNHRCGMAGVRRLT